MTRVLYEYRCPHCGLTREVWRNVAERDWNVPSCVEDATPYCIGTPMLRVISSPAIRGATVSRP